MKIILHEIELGSKSPEASKDFYNQVLGLPVQVDQNGLKVFNSGLSGLDFNASEHMPPKETSLSFLVNDIHGFQQKLDSSGVDYHGPFNSHLGMESLKMKDPDGNTVIINSPTEKSPDWLRQMIK